MAGPNGKLPPGFFPRMGHGFPRNYVDETPQEILFDPTRVLGCGHTDQVVSVERTVLRQPRVETTEYRVEKYVDPRLPHGNLCPPPPSQIPYVKRLIHLDQSRDSENFFCHGCVDIPAAGVNPGTGQVLEFTTFNNLRTFIRWIDVTIYDSLCPEDMTVQMLQDGAPMPLVKCPQRTTTIGGGYVQAGSIISTPTALELTCLPPYFHNVLYEITDTRHIQFIASNTAPVDRRISICVWGWIESITTWDEYVKR